MKVYLRDSLLGRATFADYYGFDCARSAPLVVFVGAALPTDSYEFARHLEPETEREAFESARERSAVRLLVVSTPPDLVGGAPFALPLFCRHLTEELLPRVADVGAPLACAGAGLGAFLAGGFAARTPAVAALATLGGPRLAKALETPLPAALPAVCCFANLDDPLRRYADELYSLLWARGLDGSLQVRLGGSSYADYVVNGSLLDAFRFCVERLVRPLADVVLGRPA